MLTVYGIKNCETVKKALTFLNEHSLNYDFVDLKTTSLKAEKIMAWKKAMGDFPVNKAGLSFRKYKESFEAMTDSEKIKLIIEVPTLIKRPLIEKNGVFISVGMSRDKEKLWLAP